MRRELRLHKGARHRVLPPRTSRAMLRESVRASPSLRRVEPGKVPAPTRRPELGFTLIELMVTVLVVAVLATIAFPSYQDYVRRGAVNDATSTLSDLRVQMERHYQDTRTYAAGPGGCGVADPSATQYFTYACALGAGSQAYTFTATGNAGLTSGFVFTINHQNVRATTGMHANWGALPADAATRWITKKP